MSTTKKPKWTIMAYLAGDNDLPTYCISVLQQLEAVTYPDDVCVLACFDSSVPWSEGSRYFKVNCGHDRSASEFDWPIHNDLVVPERRRDAVLTAQKRNLGMTTDAFSRSEVSEGLRRFINWSMRTHPDSEHYMLVLFGHGLAVGGQNFLITENPPSFLRVEDLQEILGRHFGANRKLDILALQNCVMNGIEMAYALKDQTDLMIGSQDLVLAAGWPYEKLIHTFFDTTGMSTSDVANKFLKVCARNMLDFSIMDRSSEQAVIDLRALRESKVEGDIKELVEALVEGLDFDTTTGKRILAYPAICDATRLARLEAQAFWNETYVDLFDFCERLLKRCNEVVKTQSKLLKDLDLEDGLQPKLRQSRLVKMAKKIIGCCKSILKKEKELVPVSYHIGPNLQYSRGISIYFPWTLPGAPYIPIRKPGHRNFALRTAFDLYCEYDFVTESKWSEFLKHFFWATLRNMRRADREFEFLDDTQSLEAGLVDEHFTGTSLMMTGDLARSSPDTGAVYEQSVNIKNYPRRNYLSPVDLPTPIIDARTIQVDNPDSPPVSAQGWSLTGLVAEVIERKIVPAEKDGSENGYRKDSSNGAYDTKTIDRIPPGAIETVSDSTRYSPPTN